MRKCFGVAFLLLFSLVSCSEQHTPLAPSPAPSPTHQVVEPSVSDAVTEVVVEARVTVPARDAAPDAATPETADAEATEAPGTRPAPSPAASEAGQSLLPRFLREIDFGIPAGNSYGPRALSYHPGLERLYALTHSQGIDASDLVTAIAPAKREVLATARTGPATYAGGGILVDPVRDLVYALSASEAVCWVLEAMTLSPVKELPGVELATLDAEEGWLFVADRSALRILDTANHESIRESTLPAGLEPVALEVDPAAKRLYMAYRGSSGFFLGRYDSRTLEELGSQPLPGRPEAVQPDPERQRIYVTMATSDDHLLWSLDGTGRIVDEHSLGEWTDGTALALDRRGDRLFVGRDAYRDHGITVIDLETQKEVAEIPLSRAPSSLAWDAEHGRLFASHTYYHQISVLDVEAGTVLAVIPTAVGLVDLDTDPDRGQVFLTDTAGYLHALDSDSDEELGLHYGEGRIALDAEHGRLYTGGRGADRVRIFDLDPLEQVGEIRTKALPVADAHSGGLYLVKQGVFLTSPETLTITAAISDTLPLSPGFSPNPTAIGALVDSGSGTLFATISNGVPGSNGGTYLYVYEPPAYKRILTDTERSPWYIDVEPSTGWAYVSRSHMTSRSTALLVDGREYGPRIESLFGALKVDPVLGRLFISVRSEDHGRLFVLDWRTLDVLDSTRIPAGFELRALDPARHLLYLAREDGLLQVWSAAGGERTAGKAPVKIDPAAAGFYRLFVPPGEQVLFALGEDHYLYRSEDAARSWSRVAGGLPDEWVLDLAFSPDLQRDGTMFAALATMDQGYGVWRSADAGRTWSMTSAGLSDLAVTDVEVSPAFDQDQSVFAMGRQGGLFRSIDAGLSWHSLTDRYRPASASRQSPQRLILSPTYADDHTLMLDHYGLQRSTDGGDSWQPVGVGMKGYGFGHAVLPGNHALNPRAYYVWVPAEEQASRVFVSQEGGSNWEDAGQGPPVSGYGTGRALVSADNVLYLLWSPSGSRESPHVYRTTALLRTGEPGAEPNWDKLVSDVSAASTELELAEDGKSFLALDSRGSLLRWPVADLQWQDAAPVARPTPTPAITPEQPTCDQEPVRLARVWERYRQRLGCPKEPGGEVFLAVQRFDEGSMVWESDRLAIYVVATGASWQVHDDTFVEGVDMAYDPNLPPPPRQPVRGFGKVWREQLGGPLSDLGWAVEAEGGFDGWRQRFDQGLLLWASLDTGFEGTAYLLFDDGTWEMVPSSMP